LTIAALPPTAAQALAALQLADGAIDLSYVAVRSGICLDVRWCGCWGGVE
jgi:hypothetical protein